MSEPRTAAGWALLDYIAQAERLSINGPRIAAYEPRITAVEREAAALDVERLARALHTDRMRNLAVDDPRAPYWQEKADRIAREYEKLRTPEGEA